jgi:glycosyltransferase involved in cell wall biosynthesis
VIGQEPTFWIDVADFLEFFRYQEQPTGIQRAQMEIFAALTRARSPRRAIRFCRLDRSADQFEGVELETLERAFSDPPVAGSPRRALVRALRRTLRARRLLYPRPAPLGARTESFRAGDVLVCLGTGWENPRYIGLLARARELTVRIAVLIYDIIPVANPQWVETALQRRFGQWFDGVLANADLLLTISEHARGTLLRLAAERRIALPPVQVLHLGSGFPALAAADTSAADPRLPEPFVLYVSTIEARKNHALLLRIWRQLLTNHRVAAVPSVAFVGRRGWLVDDVMAELSREGPLRDKVAIVSGLSDAEVAAAYRRCLFTVFPSLMEGWGLPVAESLEQGRLCVASNRGAIPEVGGDLVDYFDPENDAEALAAVERAIFDRDYRQAREARIRAEFRPRSWADCAAALIEHLDRLHAVNPAGTRAGEPVMAMPQERVARGVTDVV